VLFIKIHPLNIWIALLARLFGQVAYWKCEGLPGWLRSPLISINPEEFYVIGQWNEILEEAHELFVRQQPRCPEIRLCSKALLADFGGLWLHWFVHQFEEDVQGQRLALAWTRRKGLENCVVMRGGVHRWATAAGVSAAVLPGVNRVAGSVLLDCAWEGAKAVKSTLKALARCVFPRPLKNACRRKNYPYIFAGVAPAKNNHGENKIDFAFMVRRGLLPGNDCLYLPNRSPSALEAVEFDKTGATWLPMASMSFYLTYKRRAILLLQMLASFFNSLRHGAAGIVVSGMAPAGLPWHAVAEAAHSKVFILGLDQGVLESPAVPWIRAAGIRTVLWQHALVGFGTDSFPNPSFRHRMLEQSVTISQELCVWTPADRDVLCDRAFLPSGMRPRIYVTGPLMSGDSRWLKRSKTVVYKAAGLKDRPGRRVITIFDHPTFIQGFRRQYRIPVQRISEEVHEAFFAEMLELLNRFPEIDVVLKPKRATDPRIYEGSIYKSFVDKSGKWQKAERLFVLNPNIDPYVPIALADMCIGMPFTSPVAVALNAGKPAFWYDPMAAVNDLFPRDIREALVSGQSQLFERVANSNAVCKVPISLSCGDNDPGEIFGAIITGARFSQA